MKSDSVPRRGRKLTVYTVEFEPDSAVITSLDESAEFEDVKVVIGDDDAVFLVQEDDVLGENVIAISYQQLLDLMAALRSPEGAFYARIKNGGGYGKA
jgi:hypothetical protein